jgi:hypothetical protein
VAPTRRCGLDRGDEGEQVRLPGEARDRRDDARYRVGRAPSDGPATMGNVRREHRRLTFTVGELGAMAALLLYAVGAGGIALFGADFLVWLVTLAVVLALPIRIALRRRRRALERERLRRRAQRVESYPRVWEDRAA